MYATPRSACTSYKIFPRGFACFAGFGEGDFYGWDFARALGFGRFADIWAFEGFKASGAGLIDRDRVARSET